MRGAQAYSDRRGGACAWARNIYAGYHDGMKQIITCSLSFIRAIGSLAYHSLCAQPLYMALLLILLLYLVMRGLASSLICSEWSILLFASRLSE